LVSKRMFWSVVGAQTIMFAVALIVIALVGVHYVDNKLPNLSDLSKLAKPAVRHNVPCSDTFGVLYNEEAAAANGVRVPPCVGSTTTMP
jgi:hypothetical protein